MSAFVGTARTYCSAAFAIFQRDWRIFLTYRWTVFSQFFGTFLTLAMFYYISRLVRVPAFPTPDAYFAFAVVGIMILQVFQSALGAPGRLQAELMAGTFERVVVSPFGPLGGILSTMLFPFLWSLFTATQIFAVGAWLFDVPIHWSTAALSIPVAMLGTLGFCGLGLVFAASTLVFKQTAAGMAWVTLLITVTAGVYFPVSMLPDWIQWTSDVQPFTPAMDLLRHLLVGTALSEPTLITILKLTVFAGLLLPLACLALSRAVAFGRRSGTIIEY